MFQSVIKVLLCCVVVILPVSAQAEWLSTDDDVVWDAGTITGLSQYCGRDASALIAETALYIGVHTETDQQAEAAGQLFKRAIDYGITQTASVDSSGLCAMARDFVRVRVDRLKSANATRSKVTL